MTEIKLGVFGFWLFVLGLTICITIYNLEIVESKGENSDYESCIDVCSNRLLRKEIQDCMTQCSQETICNLVNGEVEK